uniref:Uncharacterized protein n=1 Tax=Alexandrium catenella TaxID=2925 RepID=A0A7S1RCS4_ALECA
MAVLRSLILAGLCRAASASRDTQSLVQRDFDFNSARDGTFDTPDGILARMDEVKRFQMFAGGNEFLGSVKHFLSAIETPLELLMGERAHQHDDWTAISFVKCGAGIITAFNSTAFSGHVDTASKDMSDTFSELGTKMQDIAMTVPSLSGTVDAKEALRWAEQSSLKAGDAVAKATGSIFGSLAALLKDVPTEYLQRVSKSLKAVAEDHSQQGMADYNTYLLQPEIKKFFANGDACKFLKDKAADFARMPEALRKDAAEAVAAMKKDLPVMRAFTEVVDARLAPQVIASVSFMLDSFSTSVSKMGDGFAMYHEALAEVATSEAVCSRSE